MRTVKRRDFLSTGIAIGMAGWQAARTRHAIAQQPAEATAVPPASERICLFTDHLDDRGYSYREIAGMLAPLKIAGPDLTVRGGGVVLPERVAEELPKAADALGEQGMTIPMLTTNLTSAGDAAARPILSTMGKLGIRYFKLGYYHYHDLARWEEELAARRKDLLGLLELAQAAGATAGLHNHAGATIGGALWDAWEMLQPFDRKRVGFYFDPAHASIEGAKHTWKLNFQRIAPRLVMVAVKDYVWEKRPSGWEIRWCPLGEGMVDFGEFFKLLAKVPFAGPISVHIEYDPGGSTRVERIDNALAAAQRDIAFVREHLARADGGE